MQDERQEVVYLVQRPLFTSSFSGGRATSGSRRQGPARFDRLILITKYKRQELIWNNRGKRDEATDDAIDRKIIGRSEKRRTTMRSM
jgi:hypothetical protein